MFEKPSFRSGVLVTIAESSITKESSTHLSGTFPECVPRLQLLLSELLASLKATKSYVIFI